MAHAWTSSSSVILVPCCRTNSLMYVCGKPVGKAGVSKRAEQGIGEVCGTCLVVPVELQLRQDLALVLEDGSKLRRRQAIGAIATRPARLQLVPPGPLPPRLVGGVQALRGRDA